MNKDDEQLSLALYRTFEEVYLTKNYDYLNEVLSDLQLAGLLNMNSYTLLLTRSEILIEALRYYANQLDDPFATIRSTEKIFDIILEYKFSFNPSLLSLSRDTINANNININILPEDFKDKNF